MGKALEKQTKAIEGQLEKQVKVLNTLESNNEKLTIGNVIPKSALLQQLKSGFKRTINRNKYKSSVKTFAQIRYLNFLINPSFQGVNRLLNYYLLKMKMIEHHTQLITFRKWK